MNTGQKYGMLDPTIELGAVASLKRAMYKCNVHVPGVDNIKVYL